MTSTNFVRGFTPFITDDARSNIQQMLPAWLNKKYNDTLMCVSAKTGVPIVRGKDMAEITDKLDNYDGVIDGPVHVFRIYDPSQPRTARQPIKK